MKSILIFILAVLSSLTLPLISPGQAMVMAAELKHSTTESDRKSVTLTVYGTGAALVADTRDIMLASPRGMLTILDIPKTLEPETLQIMARDKRGSAISGFKVLEAAFAYDLDSNINILKRFVGEEVKLIEENSFQDRTTVTTAKLLKVTGGPVFLIDGEVHLNHPGRIVLPESDGVTLEPALGVRYMAKRPTAVDLTAVYMADGFGWSADYALTLGDTGSSALLSGWITVRNESGMDFKDAVISVVAGSVNRAQEARRVPASMTYSSMKEAYDAPETKGLFDYYLIKIPGEKTVMDGASKHFAYLSSTITGVKKEYTVRDRTDYMGDRYGETKLPVEVSVTFENSEENNAATVLPGGIMRIYREGGDGSTFFIGEERIGNTPKGAQVRVKAGNAFDITATRKTTDYKRIRARLHEEAVSVTLKKQQERGSER